MHLLLNTEVNDTRLWRLILQGIKRVDYRGVVCQNSVKQSILTSEGLFFLDHLLY
jgi:hypothetical protein